MNIKPIQKLLSNSYICHLIGIFFVLSILNVLFPFKPETVVNSFWITSGCYLISAIVLPKISAYLLVERKYYILPVVTTVFVVAMSLIFLTRVDYSRSVLIYGGVISFCWFYITSLIRQESQRLVLFAIPNFDIKSLNQKGRVRVIELKQPFNITDVKGSLVVDLHRNLTPESEKFIADCSLANISVFHAKSIKEMLEGKVQTEHLSENAIGTLLPNPLYMTFKRVWESLVIIASFPITLPIMVITAILIKLENPGPAMFIQERVGQGGKVFRIYKFRSMTIKAVGAEDKFATQEQARVTKVGKVIRKVRIDELPQFFNVLKGDMSLIGPRPEQDSFVKQFEKEIPFYGYRHMVKPGITGWAQVVQGYADDTESTTVKVAYDLYYIKHLSFWLDINIVFKTIRTMLTGFGAK
ncbi:UDP-glucose lipid carrier transferase [Photobacterium angustum]|uniref:UDP-glucose lipid carrier transferase n=1 Tax=Photobacterium angustum TaxID=661 RepID=A0A855SBT1_PHOAN|nr:exopolysaccharide biosynthesis polyprenyl glycosylphosphotransferase [Photobacterium angustum]PSW89632.1 UDP-glucose lipid carrier transferase [Photobacterium angustum]PSX06976.1 UDP-glucose lipid carrier transferase [Photobacterium angustum]PSX14875.1 UDP-glucose lipid carrier transferase [Photobacterium angustum]PSX23407.1 UDP-glucose lipid carrier transferase [Photobacterium angustum]PSX39353.1 UDP-glucose lipid carrier transferase [Photobacterium angustum]